MKDILDKIQLLDNHFRASDKPEKERFLERLVKLNEEVGELCEAALCEVDVNQRAKERVTDFDGELADVIICALLLGHSRTIDIESIIHQTLNKNLQRHNLK